MSTKKENDLISWVLWVLRHLWWVLVDSHMFFLGGEESIGDAFVRSGYNVELYRSFIDICWVWPLPSNCDHQDDITFCPH